MKSFKQIVERKNSITKEEPIEIDNKIELLSETVHEENLDPILERAEVKRWVEEAPEFYQTLWESLNDKVKDSITKQSLFYEFNSQEDVDKFWKSRRNIPHPVDIIENDIKETEEPEVQGRKLFRDKMETFECEIQIEGARKDQTQVRMVVETEDWSLVFPGKFNNGKCEVPIKKLSILEEGMTGTMKLEVIVEDTIFVPWEENFTVKNSKNVKVKMNENTSSTQNSVSVRVIPG